jgi:hypothetical protein
MEQSQFEKLTGSQLIKEFPAFCGTRKVHYLYKCLPIVPILSQNNPISSTGKWIYMKTLDFALKYTLPYARKEGYNPTDNINRDNE